MSNSMRLLSVLLLAVMVHTKSASLYENAKSAFQKETSMRSEDLDRLRSAYDQLSSQQTIEFQKQTAQGKMSPVMSTLPKTHRIPKDEILRLNNDILPFLFQGDILLSPSQAESLLENHRTKRGIQTDPKAFWTVGQPIPYYFDSSISSEKKQGIREAIDFWQNTTCLSFVEDQTKQNRLRFFSGSGCYSAVGKQYNQVQQGISIGDGCEGLGTAAHEIAHALGFFHTQSRPDRDQFVYIDFNNISPSAAYNFVKNTRSEDNVEGISYDFGSLMHYSAYGFALDQSKPSIISNEPQFMNVMGQRDVPSFSDVKTMNLAYNCQEQCDNKETINCKNGGFPNPNKCSTCLCPKYFAGDDCSQLPQGNAPICNGAVLTAKSSWQTLNGTVGRDNYDGTSTPEECFWHIQAPEGRTVAVMMTTAPNFAGSDCYWQAIEVNLGNPDVWGMILCDKADVNHPFRADGSFVAIRALARFYINNFEIKYIYV